MVKRRRAHEERSQGGINESTWQKAQKETWESFTKKTKQTPKLGMQAALINKRVD